MIPLIIYLSNIVLWIFSYHIWVVDCWPFFPHWTDQRSLNLKLVLGWDWKVSVGCIQTIHMYLLSAYVCGRSYIGCRLGVQTCLLQFIDLLYLKSPSSSLFKPSFVDFWLFVSYLLDQIVLILKLVLVCDCKFSLGRIQTRQMYFILPQVCVRSWQGCRSFFHLSPSIHWLASRQLLWFLLRLIYKNHVSLILLLILYVFKRH